MHKKILAPVLEEGRNVTLLTSGTTTPKRTPVWSFSTVVAAAMRIDSVPTVAAWDDVAVVCEPSP